MPLSHAYPLAVRYRVRDLATVRQFLGEVLDIPVREQGQGYLRLDNSSICMFLVEDRDHPDVISLALAATEVGEAVEELLGREGVVLSRQPGWTAPDRYEAELRVGDWLHLLVGRTYNEDELGVLPDLETQLDWGGKAETLLKELLSRVPIAFRKTAREKSVARAEALTMERGDVTVDHADAVRALVECTPTFQHPLLYEVLRELGTELASLTCLFAHLSEVRR